jgi:hypothetical protein
MPGAVEVEEGQQQLVAMANGAGSPAGAPTVNNLRRQIGGHAARSSFGKTRTGTLRGCLLLLFFLLLFLLVAFRSPSAGADAKPGRCAVSSADLRDAQRFFLSTFALPTLAYYLGAERTFPATISWTIRAGWPKWLHHVLWLSGWAYTVRAVSRAETAAGLVLCAVMVAVGVVAVVLAPIGISARTDRVHNAASLVYILLHIPWFTRWCVPVMPYQAGFYAALLVFLLNMSYMRYLKRTRCTPGLCGFADPEKITGVELLRRLRASSASSHATNERDLDPERVRFVVQNTGMSEEEARRNLVSAFRKLDEGKRLHQLQLGKTLYRLELLEMVLENAVFMFFVVGMTARTPDGAVTAR